MKSFLVFITFSTSLYLFVYISLILFNTSLNAGLPWLFSFGKYVPAKPSKIIFTTNTYRDLVVGQENKMIANRWKVTYPHSVRKETVLCSSCHGNERAFLLESDENRILYPDKDGLAVKSFYNSESFSIDDARFVTRQEYNEKINIKSKEYLQKYFEKLKCSLINIFNDSQLIKY